MTMNKFTIATIGVAVLVVGSGAVAAQSTDAMIEVPNPDPPVKGPTVDDPAEEEPLNESEDVNETDEVPEGDMETQEEDTAERAAEGKGPPVDMPEQVPDHVTEIHETIRPFLEGSLGDAISDITPDDDESGQGSPQDG